MRFAAVAFLTFDFAAHRDRFRESVNPSVMNIFTRVAETIEWAHRRFRKIREAVIQMSQCVSGQRSNIQEAIQVSAVSQRYRFAEFTHQAAVLVEYADQSGL